MSFFNGHVWRWEDLQYVLFFTNLDSLLPYLFEERSLGSLEQTYIFSNSLMGKVFRLSQQRL